MNNKSCTCGTAMRFAETASFRVGGTSGGWKLLFGEWAELGESMIPLDIYVCPECGRVELVEGEETKQRLLKLSGARRS
jgi:hypothetical protein